MDILSHKPKRILTVASVLLYALVLSYGAVSAFRQPLFNWDALPYMDLVLLSEGQTPQSAHAKVYQDIQGKVDSEVMTGITWDKAMAASPQLFGTQLPFYRFRIGYIFMIRALNQSGIGLVSAAKLVSIAGYVGIGVLLFLWMLRYTSAPLAFIWGAILMIGGRGADVSAGVLARLVTPDAFATFLVLCGVYCVFEKEALAPGLGLLFGAVFFRTDAVLYLIGVLAWLVVTHRLKLYPAGALGVAGSGTVWLLNRYSGAYDWTILFNNSFVGVKLNAANEVARVSAHEYLYYAFHNFHMLADSGALFLLFLSIASYMAKPKNRACIAALLTTATVAVRYLLYPTPELRQYAPALLMGAVAVFVALMSTARTDFPESESYTVAAREASLTTK